MKLSTNLSRRQHLHQQLDSTKADVTHKTEETGSPHTLIITKTNASYENDIKRRQQEQALLASLQCLLSVRDGPSAAEPPSKRQKTAGNSTNAVSSSQDVSFQQTYIRGLDIQWNPSYPGGLVPTGVRISEMSVTMNQIQYALILHILYI